MERGERPATTSTWSSASIADFARKPAPSMPLSKDRISSSRRKRARSCCSTRSACSRMATVGSAKSPRISSLTPLIGERAMIAAIFFYLFAGTAIAAAVMVIAAKNPVHSVLFLILTFVNAAGLFVLLGAEFLAMILIIVYVGAVLVLFLFVVMMLDVDFAQLRQGFLQYLPIGAFIGIIVLIELLLVVFTWNVGPHVQHAIAAPIPPLASMPNTEA